MPFIEKITKVLPGNAPEWVRRALVGVDFVADYPSTFMGEYGFTFIGDAHKNRYVMCCISSEDAIDALLKADKFFVALWFCRLFSLPGFSTIVLGPGDSEFIRHIEVVLRRVG